ncbi:MAG TPA: response regulator [Aeromonadales bacterium]|nr:response regulator [Aeromonadales bacterium]
MNMESILLVEDNADDEALALRAFTKQDIKNKVIVARDGEQALDILLDKEIHEIPRVIFLDLNLPKINGFEVLEKLRANPRTSLVPVVILSSSSELIDREKSYQLGANSYVQKPVDFQEFLDVVQNLGRYWLRFNLQATMG